MTTKAELLDSLTRFEEGYLEAMFWLERVDFGEGEHLEDVYGFEALTKASLERVREDCEGFIEAAQKAAEKYPGVFWEDDEYDPEVMEASSQAGHDFFLTRNGHGTGFWDRGLGAWGRTLTDISKRFGSTYAYASRGHIYVD
jgi:hypothetical protein